MEMHKNVTLKRKIQNILILAVIFCDFWFGSNSSVSFLLRYRFVQSYARMTVLILQAFDVVSLSTIPNQTRCLNFRKLDSLFTTVHTAKTLYQYWANCNRCWTCQSFMWNLQFARFLLILYFETAITSPHTVISLFRSHLLGTSLQFVHYKMTRILKKGF